MRVFRGEAAGGRGCSVVSGGSALAISAVTVSLDVVRRRRHHNRARGAQLRFNPVVRAVVVHLDAH